MILTFTGFILLFFPLGVLVFINKNKYTGFANGIFVVLLFQTVTALFLQMFHLFTYTNVLMVNILADVILLYFFRHKLKHSIPVIFDPIMVFVLVVSVGCLYQVNYNYTGKVSDLGFKDYKEVSHFVYPYPYYSDEWYAVAFIKRAMNHNALPTKNPYSWRQSAFMNLEFVSHSLLAQIVVLLKLEPLKDYTKMSIGFNVIIILLIYLFVRNLQVSAMTAGMAALSALFITNGANLPTLWTLIPITIGLIILLLSLFYFNEKNFKMMMGTAGLLMVFYPLLFVLFLPALGFYVVDQRKI